MRIYTTRLLPLHNITLSNKETIDAEDKSYYDLKQFQTLIFNTLGGVIKES